jgi:hypothetical protein
MPNDVFKVNIHCVVFSTDIAHNKKYILSTNDEKIEFPVLLLNKDNSLSINENLISFLKNHIYVNDLELIPQIINVNSEFIKNTDLDTPTLNMIYGFIVSHSNSLNNTHWVEFDFLKPNEYSNIIFEVIQKLR